MLIDLTCPAEVFRVDLPAADSPVCTVMLYNLDDRTIASCEATVRMLDSEGTEKQRTVHRSRALHGRPGTVFPMTVPCEKPESAVSAEVTVDKVWFEDNDVWRREPGKETEYVSNRLPVSRELSDLQYVAGDSAVGFPSQQEHLWICVCGRPNSNRNSYCVRCRRKKDLIFEKYNREAVTSLVHRKERQMDLQTRSVREDTARLQRDREEAYNRRRQVSRRRRTVLTALLCAFAICGIAVFALIPGLRLLSGRISLQNGRLSEAESTLSSLGSFPGAAPLLTECRFRIAERDAGEAADPEKLEAASAFLRSAQDREGAAALADRADFTRAGLLLGQGNAEQARALLETLPDDYPERTEQIKACDYALAESLQSQRRYDEARSAFLALGDWSDAKDRADSCLYASSMEMIENGEYDHAIACLHRISGYTDSADQILRAQYLKGLMLENAGDTDGACEAFRAAGSYEDAQLHAEALVYSRAAEAEARQDWSTASELYGSITSYEDAAVKYKNCVLTLARKAYSDKEYLRTDELLLALPPDDPDVTALRNDAVYQEVRVMLKKKEYGFAVNLLARIPGYRDADELMKSTRYSLARTLLDAGDAKGAEEQFLLLGDYKDSERLLTKARKMLNESGAAPAVTPGPDTEKDNEYIVIDETEGKTDEK